MVFLTLGLGYISLEWWVIRLKPANYYRFLRVFFILCRFFTCKVYLYSYIHIFKQKETYLTYLLGFDLPLFLERMNKRNWKTVTHIYFSFAYFSPSNFFIFFFVYICFIENFISCDGFLSKILIYIFLCVEIKKTVGHLLILLQRRHVLHFIRLSLYLKEKKTDNVIYLALIDTILPDYCRLLLLGKTAKWISFIYCLYCLDHFKFRNIFQIFNL